jgi:hypothetical protein
LVGIGLEAGSERRFVFVEVVDETGHIQISAPKQAITTGHDGLGELPGAAIAAIHH